MTMTGTYGQIESSLQAAIVASLPDDDANGDYYVYILDFSDTFVIYCVGWDEYLQDDYTMDSSGNVKLAGKPEPVKSVTTYVPVESEAAGVVNVERRGIGPAVRPEPAKKSEPTSVITLKSEPLTYHRHSSHSYFRDLLLEDRVQGARERLSRHGEEMRVISEERNQRAWRGIREGGFEYRVEPSQTDGAGGYFTIPLWMNQYFATAVRPARVVAGLMPSFDLPAGVSSVSIPLIGTGTRAQHVVANQSTPDRDITDSSGSSSVVTIAGNADVALQMLEQSPAGAHIDFVLLKDMMEDLDRDLETQLLTGKGSAYSELLGVVNADTAITYTDASPTASKMWTYFGEAAAQLGDARLLPPEIWLMRTARWSWLNTAEDTAGRPFGIPAPFFLGSDTDTPDPVGGLISWPVFVDDAISPTQGVGANQDFIVCMRPTDLLLFEGQPRTSVMREVLSGTLGARIHLHNSYAAITNRYVSGIYSIQGTGMVVQSGL